MIRSVGLVMAAILLLQPTMARSLAHAYAELLVSEGRQRAFDPLTVVAIHQNESRWIAGLVGGRGGQCIGLGQHCLFNYPYCREDPDGARCRSKRAELFDPFENTLATTRAITAWRKECRRRTGHAELRHWLAAYQGYNQPARGIWCGQERRGGRWIDRSLPTQTAKVLRLRRCLEVFGSRQKKGAFVRCLDGRGGRRVR